MRVTLYEIEQANRIIMQEAASLPGVDPQQILDFARISPEVKNRKRLGRAAIRKYRKSHPGAINWESFRVWFHAWILEHKSEIDFARLIVSILMLLLML